MVTPAKGEYRRIPASPAAIPLINAWDPAADEKAGNQCRSYGAGGIMNVPGRLHITWQDANTLRIDTDAGTQTRRLRFAASKTAKPEAPSWQGDSSATWEPVTGGGSLRVVTTNMRSGYLRKNGVPYSEQATITEYIHRLPVHPNGDNWLHVITVVDDPKYLSQPFYTSTSFRLEPNDANFKPTACATPAPLPVKTAR
jgi:hypothetical protein